LTQAAPGKKAPSRHIRLGDRDAIVRGLRPSFWSDLHHRALTLRWSVFFGAAALVFLVCNLTFAALYMLGDDPIANARPGTFLDYFFFSIETFATVGYGDMHPRTTYGHTVAAAGAFIGVCSLAVTTGLIFTRFTLPRARVLFALTPVMARFDETPMLMVRIANARGNQISGASAKLWLTTQETTAEGRLFRRVHRLPLVADENPLFALTWTILHRVDEGSPFAAWTEADFHARNASLIIIFEGYDESSGHTLRSRKNYRIEDVAYGRDYVDIMTFDERGAIAIDYRRFHETIAAPL
jgi:inward rectifier potassium channel